MSDLVLKYYGILKDNIRGTKSIWLLVLLLMGISILEIYSISGANTFASSNLDSEVFFISRIKHVFFAIFIMLVLQLLPASKYVRNINWIKLFYVGGLFVQIMLRFFGSDDSTGGASKRSIFGIQPTEFAIIFTLIYAVFLFQKNQSIIKDINYLPLRDIWRWGVLKIKTSFLRHELTNKDKEQILKRRRTLYILRKYAIPMAMPVILMFFAIAFFGDNLSTALILVMVWGVSAFIAGLPFWKHLGGVFVLLVIGLVTISILSSADVGRARTWKSRIDGYGENLFGKMPNVEDKDYCLTQVNMAEIAIALGNKPAIFNGGSIQRSLLQQSYTDYIFSIIVERYTLFGAILLMVLYSGLFYRIRGLGKSMKSNYDSMIVYTLGLYILIQMTVHVYVSTGLMPSTGLTLPFISKGGSSLLAMSFAVGIILSFNKSPRLSRVENIESDEFIEELVKESDLKNARKQNEEFLAEMKEIEEKEEAEICDEEIDEDYQKDNYEDFEGEDFDEDYYEK